MAVDLTRKRIIVTGAAAGIGRAVALRVSACGGKVAVFDIDSTEGQNTVKEINNTGGDARYWQVDVRDDAAVSSAVEVASYWLTGVDVLIHMAGILQGAGLEIHDFPEDEWDIVLDTNLKGTFLICKHVSAVMRREKNGVIILASSGAGVTAGSSSLAYGASKGGVHGLTMVMHKYFKKYGIRVNDIAPGSVRTPMKLENVKTMHQKHPADKSIQDKIASLSSPDDVAKIIAFMASDEAKLLKGTVFTG